MRAVSARQLKGRTIVGYDPRPFDDGRGGTAYCPVIYLDDGSCLCFTTQETEVGDYGVKCVKHTNSSKN